MGEIEFFYFVAYRYYFIYFMCMGILRVHLDQIHTQTFWKTQKLKLKYLFDNALLMKTQYVNIEFTQY